MISQEQIDEQIALERQAIHLGVQRLKENTRKLESQTYASATAYGGVTIKTLLPVLAKEIEESTFRRIRNGKAGPYFADVADHLLALEHHVIASIGLKMMFDHLFSHNEGHRRVQAMASAIGAALEAECQIRWYEQTDGDLMDSIRRNYWHSSAGTRQRLTVSRLMMNRKGNVWKTWGTPVRVRLGMWVLECVSSCCGWVRKVVRTTHKRNITYLYPTEELLEIRERLNLEAEIHSPMLWPMLIPPQPWTSPTDGGYLLNEVMSDRNLIRSSRNPDDFVSGTLPIHFLNTLQNVAYRLNPFVVGVAEVLYERKIEVGKFVPMVHQNPPPKPHDIAENEASRKTYCREAAEIMNRNAQAFKRSCRTRHQMDLVQRFKDRDRYYLPWSFDYRGRSYPIPAYLTPQDTDFGKSLIRFADEAPLTEDAEYWLAFQVATAYGLDKATITERWEWVSLNNDLITAVATDPIGNLDLWAQADEPWQFLAACEEFHACCIASTRQTTGLPVAVDATCSGLQILAGLARDRSTAQLVNVLPGDSPSDAYKAVAEEAKRHLPERLRPFIDRKTTKRTVMTVPYNATKHSSRGYIRDALKKSEVELESGDLTLITNAIYNAMELIVPGPMAVMRWINKEVSRLMKDGETKLSWVTPTGFRVYQKLMKQSVLKFNLKLLGRCQVNVNNGDTPEVDKSRHKAATAPNLIHSLDSSILHYSFGSEHGFGGRPFTVIHDSIMCRATDMDEVNRIVREAYKFLFSDNDFLTDFANQIGALTPPPIIGDLDPNEVLNSTYFFS
jgi:DNA-directed RNA polymerase